jgi:hypothetical protein|tara:strand:- start:4768 stop:4875 length:108 start_codon:yes stop_codon:yes gene_type:complete
MFNKGNINFVVNVYWIFLGLGSGVACFANFTDIVG